MQEKMQMQYMVVGFSHKNVDISLRESLSIPEEQIVPFLQEVNACDVICESVLLCTCNRIELYLSVYDTKVAKKHIYECFSKKSGIAIQTLEQVALVRLNEYAVYHIFGVASSLDSLVIGETQITGQLKSAYKLAFEHSLCGKDMTRLMHFAFKCAASVRKQTEISAHSVSVASTAVSMAAQKLAANNQSLESLPVLVIGSGEMGRLVCKHLLNLKAHITLLSRTYANAQNLALELGGDKIVVRPYEDLRVLLDEFSLLFSATSAQGYVITQDMPNTLASKRYWFDLALPRDIESGDMQSVSYHNIEVFCVDDLQEVVQEHKQAREESAKAGKKIIEAFTCNFFTWLQTLSVEPVIKHMRALAKESAHKELERAIKKGFLPAEYRHNVEKILHGAFNTFLHQPTMRLRQASESHQGDPIIEAMKSMFDIDDEIVMLNSYKCERDTTF
ncbi:glutamyl-tRNA reductase [Helicobacter marmotae]|uniref:Glutamyl-tRNA reductase n=1 Tax=Helicobacter marmotae TaxID=152490 RepID=A0A3D8I8D3_9HELI|nr:glutamyl-tRNA reductase [Helicobacter marmotae]RDU60811.1 glutamyl-tRNA reductase [Helicobacter marmotae]